MKIVSVTLIKPAHQKKAMAVPGPRGDVAQRWKGHGFHLVQDMINRMPQAKQVETMDAIVNSGASEFFKDMEPRTVISLPSIYELDPDDVFEIEGRQYVCIYVEPPRVVGQKWDAPSGAHYEKAKKGLPPTMFEGEVVALDLDTGMPKVLPLPPIKDKVIAPTGNREAVLQRANAEIEKYNERIRTIGKAIGASKLVLQISRAKLQLQDRLVKLEGIRQGTQAKLDRYRGAPLQDFEAWANDLREQINSGAMSLKDAYDSILYLHMSTPEKLIQDVEAGNINIPEEFKAGILAIARKEMEIGAVKLRQEEEEKRKKQEEIEKKTIPEIHDTEITPFTLEDIPGGAGIDKTKYRKMKTHKSVWSIIASLKASLAGTTKDIEELTKIKQSIENMEQYMGSLEKGQRGKAFLNTPEGKSVLDAMNKFLVDSSLFIKRYATDIIQDGKVNPRLMGSEGTEGNAIVAVALTRMYNVVKETIDMYTGGEDDILPQKEEAAPANVPVVPASSKNKITKMSELLWKAFEERMRIR